MSRFIARRGKPKTIYSDNGTKFQGSANELHKNLQDVSQMAKIQDSLATEGCNWRFIPPHETHIGRLVEAAVKSITYHLWWILGAHVAAYKEIPTLFAEIQVCLHSRPLCALSSDPLNPTFNSLTILIGKPLPNYLLLTSVTCNRHPRWQSTNNFNSFGNDGHPTSTGSSTANAGRGHPLTYLQSQTNSVIGGWGQHPTSRQTTWS